LVKNMHFFTDITTNASNYCLLHIKKYNDKRKENKKIIFVDPGVYELTKNPEYSNIKLLHDLASGRIPLQYNEFISIDYPCDMNIKYSEEFIRKTYENNIKYAENKKYICTVQYKFKDINSFYYEMERTKHIWSKPGKILGLGNLCRIYQWAKGSKTEIYLDKISNYLITNSSIISRIHFYGIGIKFIRRYFPFLNKYISKISVDSTKWTRAVNNKLKYAHGVCCRKNTRDLYFTEYTKYLKKLGFRVIY